jgi:hypothetical protein
MSAAIARRMVRTPAARYLLFSAAKFVRMTLSTFVAITSPQGRQTATLHVIYGDAIIDGNRSFGAIDRAIAHATGACMRSTNAAAPANTR